MKHEFKIDFELIPYNLHKNLDAIIKEIKHSNFTVYIPSLRTALLNSLIPLPAVPTLLLRIIKIERSTSAAFGNGLYKLRILRIL